MKRKAFFFAGLMCLYLFLEISLRLVLCISSGADFFHPSRLIYRYYPELIPIKQAAISNTDSTLDVLILSCSVLHKDWADIVEEMNKCLQLPRGFNRIRIYNASGVGHGSRDNMIKYDLLSDKKFDLIIYYDAINDSRLNNCPDYVFKNNYSHYLWYDEINHIISHPEMDFTVIPFFYDWMKIRLKALFVREAYIPQHFSMRPEWLVYGSNLKSVMSYEANVKEIVAKAQVKHAQFLYLTFAYYLPANYTLQKFHDKTLDYSFCDHSRETEIWGLSQNVSRFIDTVNVGSKTWLSPSAHVKRVDLNAKFPKDGSYFADVCHFSPKGIRRFAELTCRELDSLVLAKGN